MVASGVASKGLDFIDIQHVIIFSMPKEIEDYVHQIGRTGRSGKTGIATTFVNMNTPEQTLLDLKYLLMEAGQKYVCSVNLTLPYSLNYALQSSSVPANHRRSSCSAWRIVKRLSCLWRYVSHFSYQCMTLMAFSGLGHGISNCPKLEDTQRRIMAAHRPSDDRGGY